MNRKPCSCWKQEPVSLVMLDLNFSIETSGEEGMALLQQVRQMNAVVPIILITGWGTIELAVQGMKLGANDFINKPWNNDHLLQSVNTLLNLRDKKKEQHNRKQLDSLYNFQHIIGEDQRMLELLETIGRGRNGCIGVGVGREWNRQGTDRGGDSSQQQKSKQTIYKVNLGGISTSLFESEMFGHVRGALPMQEPIVSAVLNWQTKAPSSSTK